MNELLLVSNNEIKKYNIDHQVLQLLFDEKIRLCNHNEVDSFNDYITKIKKLISNYDEVIPLFDIYSETIYLINKENVYNRVFSNHYRLPDKKLIEQLLPDEK